MIEAVSAKVIEGAAKAAVERATELQAQRDMALMLQQQETMRLGEVSAREVLHREAIMEREALAADELRAKLEEETPALDKRSEVAPDAKVVGEGPERGSGALGQGAWNEGVERGEISLESCRRIYEPAGVDVDRVIHRTLVDRDFPTYRLPRLEGDLIGPDGMSNMERTQQGLAAYKDIDGRLVKVELHHHGQQGDGPLVELDSLTHRKHHGELHPGLGKGEGRGDDPLWSHRVSEYWKQREFSN